MLVVCWFVYDGHSDQYEVVSHCGFNLYLWWQVMLSILSYVSGLSVYPPWRNICSGHCPFLMGLFVFLEWSHMSSLYNLEIKHLSEVPFANIFSQRTGSLFISLMFSLAVQKLFLLIKSQFFILSIMSLALGDISLKILLCGISEIFLPMFSSRTLWYHNLYLSPLFILSLFLCMV